MEESRTINAVKNSFASLALKVVVILSRFALRTAFIYLLGNEYTGVSGLFTDILQVLSLMEMGLDVSMVYALYKPIAEKDEQRISALMNFYKKAFTAIGIAVLVIGIACVPFLNFIVKDVSNIKEDIHGIFCVYVFTTASSYFFIYRSILLKADQKSRIVSKWTALFYVVETFVEIVLLLILKEFFAYLITHLFATLGLNYFLSKTASKMYPQYFKDRKARLDKNETLMLVRDMLCLTAYDLAGIVINSTDSIFISAFVGTVQVAVVGNYTMIIRSIRTTVGQIIYAVRPSIGNLAATSSADKQRAIFEKLDFMSFYAACFCSACLYALLSSFIGDIWLSPEYKISSLIVVILCVNFYISIMVFPVESFRIANGLFVQGWIRPLVTAVLNVILDFAMGKKWGVAGIYLATTISRVLTQVWFDPYLIYKLTFKVKVWKYYLKYICRFLFSALICAFTGFVCNLFTIFPIYIQFLLKMLFALVLPNVCLIIAFRRSSDLRYMFQIAKVKILRR